MRYGRGGFFARGLLALLVVGGLMALAFWAGVAVNGDNWNPNNWGGHYAGGYAPYHFFGFLFGLLVLILIVGLIARAIRGPRYYGGPGGYGPWAGPGWHGGYRHWREDAWRQEAESAMEDWHRRAHGETGPEGSTEQPPKK